MSTTTTTSTSSSPTSSTSPASATSTDTTYDFSIKEATIRNTAIGVCLALFVFLVCALIGLEIMRRRLKRMRKQLLRYASREEDGMTQYLGPPSLSTVGGGGGSIRKMDSGISSSSPASSDDVRYQKLVSPPVVVMKEQEQEQEQGQRATEVSVQGEVFESDARSLRSFHRGETCKHNKNVAGRWYDLRGHVNRE